MIPQGLLWKNKPIVKNKAVIANITFQKIKELSENIKWLWFLMSILKFNTNRDLGGL